MGVNGFDRDIGALCCVPRLSGGLVKHLAHQSNADVNTVADLDALWASTPAPKGGMERVTSFA